MSLLDFIRMDFRRKNLNDAPSSALDPIVLLKLKIADARARPKPVKHMLSQLSDLIHDDLRKSTNPDFAIPGMEKAA